MPDEIRLQAQGGAVDTDLRGRPAIANFDRGGVCVLGNAHCDAAPVPLLAWPIEAPNEHRSAMPVFGQQQWFRNATVGAFRYNSHN